MVFLNGVMSLSALLSDTIFTTPSCLEKSQIEEAFPERISQNVAPETHSFTHLVLWSDYIRFFWSLYTAKMLGNKRRLHIRKSTLYNMEMEHQC